MRWVFIASRSLRDAEIYCIITRLWTSVLPPAAATRLVNLKHSGKRSRLVRAREYGDEHFQEAVAIDRLTYNLIQLIPCFGGPHDHDWENVP
jgi:hypothetical protein